MRAVGKVQESCGNCEGLIVVGMATIRPEGPREERGLQDPGRQTGSAGAEEAEGTAGGVSPEKEELPHPLLSQIC